MDNNNSNNKENILNSYISLFNEGYYSDNTKPLPFIKLFLQYQTEENWNNAIKFFNDFLQTVNVSEIYNVRIVSTISDGTVWFDSAKNSTYAGFKTKTINENHNTRRPFMQVLFSNFNNAYEIKSSSSTGNEEYRVCNRVGEDFIMPLGVNGFSITL